MPTPSYEEIRQRVESRYNRYFYLIAHIIMAFITTAVIWAIDPTPADGSPVIAALWVGILICHAVKVFMDGLKDKAIERTWRQYYGEVLVDEVPQEKPKRVVRLEDEPEDEVAHTLHQQNGHSTRLSQERN